MTSAKHGPSGARILTSINLVMKFLQRRLPNRRDIGYAYGGVVFIVYSWALRGFFYQLSSLILYHALGDILPILSYMLALALLESLVVLISLLALAFILPSSWLIEGFGYKAFLAVIVAGAAAVGLESYITRQLTNTFYLYAGLAASVAILLGLVLLIERLPPIKRMLVGLLDRLSLFTYIYVPLGILSLLVVLIRNLG
jgi:hypothetical protein